MTNETELLYLVISILLLQTVKFVLARTGSRSR